MIRRKEKQDSLTPGPTLEDITFIADAMLGRLARWLRFLGFNTLYFPAISDSRLIRISREQDRLILTRDTRLVQAKAVQKYLLIRANDPHKQLLEVMEGLDLKTFNLFSRCVQCNGQLERVTDRNVLKESIPEYVFLHSSAFLKCTACDKIYWEGTHPKKFKDILRDIVSLNI